MRQCIQNREWKKHTADAASTLLIISANLNSRVLPWKSLEYHYHYQSECMSTDAHTRTCHTRLDAARAGELKKKSMDSQRQTLQRLSEKSAQHRAQIPVII